MKPCSDHMMIDIETLGNGANALIVQIGVRNIRCARTYLEAAELSVNQAVQTEHGSAHMAVVDARKQAEAIIRANLKLKDKAYGNPTRFLAMPMV